MVSRFARLAVEAHSRGIIDFSQAQSADYRWQLKEKILLDTVENILVKEMNELAHDWHCSAAQVTGWDEEEALFEHHRRMAHKAYNTIGSTLLPWYKEWVNSEGKSLTQLWKEFKDREKDPEYAALLKAERERLRSLAKEAEDQEKAAEEALKFREENKAKQEALKVARRQRRGHVRR